MFDSMRAWRQWVVWGAGKVPLDRSTGYAGDSQDPANWSDYETARADVERVPGALGVGFVFTDSDPFFFVDLDHAWDGEKWNALAAWVASLMPSNAFEVSQSGTGAHFFGAYTETVPHGNKRTDIGLELYTSGRFAAMTGTAARGDAFTNDDAYRAIAALLPPAATASVDALPDGPAPDWNGPVDDAELLARFFAQRPSATAAFRGGPTNRQLWEGDPDALAVAFPSDRNPFDASSAELSLAAKLAFWTGRDAARIERLMSSAPLCDRDKWRERGDYRSRTIATACAGCESVYGGGGGTSSLTVDVTTPVGDATLAPDVQRERFAGCVYVADRNRIMTATGEFYPEKVFRSMFGGYSFMLDWEGAKTSNAWEAFVESRVNPAPRVHSTTFRPEDPPGTFYREAGRDLVNSYVPAQVDAEPGDIAPVLDLLSRMVPDEREREILVTHGAAIVQHPGVKFQWAPVLQGAEGNGKSFWARCIAGAVGDRYSHFPNAADIGNKFNAWIREKLFVCVEEIHGAANAGVQEALKALITNARIEVQAKGADQITGDNRANFCSRRTISTRC